MIRNPLCPGHFYIESVSLFYFFSSSPLDTLDYVPTVFNLPSSYPQAQTPQASHPEVTGPPASPSSLFLPPAASNSSFTFFLQSQTLQSIYPSRWFSCSHIAISPSAHSFLCLSATYQVTWYSTIILQTCNHLVLSSHLTAAILQSSIM